MGPHAGCSNRYTEALLFQGALQSPLLRGLDFPCGRGTGKNYHCTTSTHAPAGNGTPTKGRWGWGDGDHHHCGQVEISAPADVGSTMAIGSMTSAHIRIKKNSR